MKLIHFSTSDNLELNGLLYTPNQTSQKVVIHVHGMGDNCMRQSFNQILAEEYAKNGIAYLTFNHRGSGAVSYFLKKENGKTKEILIGDSLEIFEDCVLDIQAAIDFVKSQGYTDIFLQGHSLGAVKVAYYLGKMQSSDVKKLLVLSFADMIDLGKDDKLYEQNLTEAKQLVSEGKGDEILSELVWDEHVLSAKTFLNFFTEGNEIDIFNFYQPDQESKILSQIKIPVIATLGEKDDIYIHGDELKRLKTKLPNSPSVTTLTIPSADHMYRGCEQELASTLIPHLLQ